MNTRLKDVCIGIFIAGALVAAQQITHDEPVRTLALEFDCLPADQGQKAITTITPDGKLRCEKHPVLGFAETNIPHLTCPVAESPDCGVE